jgi:hypothetical protein
MNNNSNLSMVYPVITGFTGFCQMKLPTLGITYTQRGEGVFISHTL